MSIHSEAVKTLNHAVAILDEYGAVYSIDSVGFYGCTVSLKGHHNTKHLLKLGRDLNKREVRKAIAPYLDDIVLPDYLR